MITGSLFPWLESLFLSFLKVRTKVDVPFNAFYLGVYTFKSSSDTVTES